MQLTDNHAKEIVGEILLSCIKYKNDEVKGNESA